MKTNPKTKLLPPGVNIITRKLASGETKTYYYYGRGRGAKRLKGEPGSPELLESLRAAAERKLADNDVTSKLIDDYLDSGRFKRLAPRTREDYLSLAEKFGQKFGKVPISYWRNPRSRGKLRKWHDELALTSPRQADYMWTVMSVVFRLAVRDGILDVNPCAGGEMLYHGTKVDNVWSSPQVGSLLACEKFSYMHLPVLIALWTGQREGDVLRMTWDQYDGTTLKLRQRKGRRRGRQGRASIVVVPVAEPLKAALDAELFKRKTAKVAPLKIEEQTICLTSAGEAWHEGKKGYTGFMHMFSEARKAAGVQGVTFGDLRGTAVTRLALAGCTVPEICAITGHSNEDANRILQAHYLHRDPAIAWNAIKKLEAYSAVIAK